MNLGLKGKIAIVTGGSKGIGAGCCEVLAEEGCNLVINYRSDVEGSEAFAKSLADRTGVKVIAVCADVSLPDEVDQLVQAALDAFGTVDILINNAGAGKSTVKKPFDQLTYGEWRMMQDNNLNSAFLMCNRLVAYWRKQQRRGHIVNVISKSAFTTNSSENTPYVSAKGGLAAMTRGLANEVTTDGIYVNGIIPGYVQTERSHAVGTERYEQMLPLLPTGKFGTPRDMGYVAAFLCSDLANQVIGALVDCTGGTML